MPAQPIAVAADVSTEVAQGSSPASGFSPGGTWSQVSLSVETRDALTVSGAPAAWKASASFSYTGNPTGSTTASTSPPSSVTLTGSSSALTCEGAPLLRDGDEASDSFGNRIVVSASGPLRSD